MVQALVRTILSPSTLANLEKVVPVRQLPATHVLTGAAKWGGVGVGGLIVFGIQPFNWMQEQVFGSEEEK
eukprot:CAMPEP_0197846176 /NCGR_PEP_ID=MMETSP1438-20131217/2967_1 /TAXON_ID=1461541 /ORGANISM="Pterosperma sp., Strain CCMP1384" /LENGTH=69 /DNA_ID=CAMNT_0043457727 /DNA_START=602 /DNA_END=811 /DNA_ORIENTATION=+